MPSENVRPAAIRENALGYFNRGEDLLREEKYAEAITEFNRALAINKDLADAYFYRGVAYYFKGDVDNAITDFTAALRIKPTEA